jgi:NAD(P)H-hydrate epimerase
LEDNGGVIHSIEADSKYRILGKLLREHDILFDGVLGTGIKLPLRGKIAELLKVVKDQLKKLSDPPEIVAVDCPSGVDSESGEVAPDIIGADLTVTMAAIKRGLLKFPAYNYVGELKLVGIGLSPMDKRSKTWRNLKTYVADGELVREILPERPLDAHKGTFGTALVVAGSVNYTGAAMLAGKAAYRSGAGLVTLAIPATLHSALAGHIPEATWILLPHELGVISEDAARIITENIGRPTAILLGPGFGTEDTTRDFLAALIGKTSKKSNRRIGFVSLPDEREKNNDLDLPPIVIDAEGFKLLKYINNWKDKLPAHAVLTPHPGEMSYVTGLSTSEIQADRISVAKECAIDWGHVVVLKGAHTIIASPDGRITMNPVATAALARAGTGDVLAGIIVGLIAQGVAAYDAAVAGSWIHGRAGQLAEANHGNSATVLAGDVLEMIRNVLQELYS